MKFNQAGKSQRVANLVNQTVLQGMYAIMTQKVCEKGSSRASHMHHMHENPKIKHKISLRKSGQEFAYPNIKHLNSSKTLL